MTNEQILITALFSLFGAIIGSGITAYFAYQFAIKRHRKERIWEMKVELYQGILTALHIRKQYSATVKSKHTNIAKIKDTSWNELVKKVADSNNGIALAMNTGRFVISDKAVDRLEKYHLWALSCDEIKCVESMKIFGENDFKSCQECIDDIIDIAKKDLRQ